MASLQKDRILSFTSPLGTDVLLPEFVAGVEGISELFYFQVELIAAMDKTIDPKKIIGSKVTVGIQADDSGKQRYINGIVAAFESCGGDEEYNNYRAYIVPNLWLLTLNTNTRVFQDKTVTDVIKAVLSKYNITASVETSNTYTPMEYCTQYRETDFDFISRLMEQHGILYYFKHTDQDHTFTLQDTSTKLSACAIQSEFMYSQEGDRSAGFYDFVITSLRSKTGLVTGQHAAWDYSFIRYQRLPDPLKSSDTNGPLGANKHEQYDYANSAAAYLKKAGSDSKISDLSNFFQTVRRDSSDAEGVVMDGVSNAISMTAGYSFTLKDYPVQSINGKYLLTRIEHNVRQVPPYRSRATSSTAPYGNSFTAVPFATAFRPPIKTRKPAVNGMHTGQVVVPSGEESHMDKYGRVCVQFFWDRERKANTPDNTLLRVAQSWAGKGWGTYFWPRVGDEVLIDFIEGDPDQPIVVGSVYNGVNMPKYDPVGQYTLSGILTRSSKSGGAANANELRFEDLKGKEQVFMNAERDYDLHVEHDHHTLVGNEQHEKIIANHYMEIDGEQHLLVKKKLFEEIDDDVHQNMKAKQTVQIASDKSESVGSNLKLKIGSDSNINVGMNQNEKVGMNYSLNVGMNHYNKAGMVYVVDSGETVHIKGGMNVVIEGGMSLCMAGPGGFVSIDPSGVSIQGMMVRINSGGAQMQGPPAQTQDPQSPDLPTAPVAPTFPGDAPPSQQASGPSGSGTTGPAISAASASPSSSAPSLPSSPGLSASGLASQAEQAAQQATQQAAQAAQQAANQAQQFANQAKQAAQQAANQAQQAVNQVIQQARQEYQAAQNAVQQAQQTVSQAAAQGQAAAQQALNQAQQAAQQTAQQAAAAVQQAQKQAQQVEQQAQQAAQQAQQAAQQAQQQAQQAVNQAEQQTKQAMQQGQQAVQQAQKQAQQQATQAVQQAQQQAQQAAKQAQQAAQQAQQQAQQAASQVKGAAAQAQQQAQQAAQQAQQSASQAIQQATRGF